MACSGLPFENKVALVTGGSRGIGKATVLALAERGARVVFNYSSCAEAADLARAEVEAAGGTALACKADLADADSPGKLVEQAINKFGQLDILVNNAGLASLQRLGERANWEAADRIWAVNTLGVVGMTRAAADVMADGGRIISIGSASGSRAGMAGAADYCGSKAALAGFTRAAAHDLAPRSITVNLIEAGMMETEMAHAMPETDKARIKASIPLGRFGRLDEITGLICFLAGPHAAYITGATLAIDGGLSA